MSNNKQHSKAPVFDLTIREEVDSTNDELRRILTSQSNTEESSPYKAVVALRQTKGKGRLGRTWASPEGSLYLSLSLKGSATPVNQATLSLVIALGVRKALAHLVSAEEDECKESDNKNVSAQSIGVKWPNDILCSQGKLVGILIEAIADPTVQGTLLVGIGVNVARPAIGAHEAAAYLSDLCTTVPDIQKVAHEVLEQVGAYYQRWLEAGCDFAVFKDEYTAHLTQLGRQVKATNYDAKIAAEGRVEGVDEQGYLILRTEDGLLTRVAGGEVTLRADA